MQVLVTGGRGYADKEHVFRVLDALHNTSFITHLIHGGAPGADQLGGQWARDRGVQEVICPANWGKHGRKAGAMRNRAMAELCPDQTVVFPGGAGTAMMTEISKERSIPVMDASAIR